MADSMGVARFLHGLALLAVGLLATVSARAETEPTPDPSARVWCYNEELTIVTRTTAWRCKHRIVSEDEAERIKQLRIRRIIDGFEKPKPLFENTRLRGTGSGFYVSAEGHVITNHHVVDDCKGISVTPAGGDALVAELLASDTRVDLALLRTPVRRSVAAPFRPPSRIRSDERLRVVGYPLHGKVTIKPILVSGRLYSGKGRPRRHRFAMHIDIRRGNSGGPVLDPMGRVVGVVVAKINTPHVFARTGEVVRNVGVAIKPTVVRRFLKSNAVDVVNAAAGAPMTDEAIFEHARRFVGQIGCWK